MIAGSFVVPRRPTSRTKQRMLPFESGVSEGAPSRERRFTVSFYLTAILFILFDIEIVFTYPWAVVYRDFIAQNGPSIFWSMLSFIGILTVGYVYAIMKGALDWKH